MTHHCGEHGLVVYLHCVPFGDTPRSAYIEIVQIKCDVGLRKVGRSQRYGQIDGSERRKPVPTSANEQIIFFNLVMRPQSYIRLSSHSRYGQLIPLRR